MGNGLQWVNYPPPPCPGMAEVSETNGQMVTLCVDTAMPLWNPETTKPGHVGFSLRGGGGQ